MPLGTSVSTQIRVLTLFSGQGNQSPCLEHREVQKVGSTQKQNKIKNPPIERGSVRGAQEPTKRTPSGQSWNNSHNKIEPLLYYNSTQKISKPIVM